MRNENVFLTMTILLAVFYGLLAQHGACQEPDTVWTRTFGTSIGEGAYAINRTSDGAYIVTGEAETYYFGPKDLYLLKIDQNGDSLWTRRYGGFATNVIGRSVTETSDGGFAAAGYAGINETNEVYLLKTDSQGDFEWDAGFGPTPDNRSHCIRETSDGGFIIAGQAWVVHGAFGSYDAYIIKTNAQGGMEWERFIGGDMNDFALSVCELQDGGFVAAGATQSFDVWDAYLFRLSAAGDSVWAVTRGGEAADEATDIMELPDGSGLVFTGVSVAPGRGDADVYLAGIDPDGQLLWSETYGGQNDDYGQSLARTPDGGYIITGMTASFSSFSWNVYVIRTDSQGGEMWSRTFGEDGDDRGHGVVQNPDGSFAVAGWTTSYGAGWLDVYLIKFEGDLTGTQPEVRMTIPADFALSQNYPNPFNARTVIPYALKAESKVSLSIYSITGELVTTPLDEVNQPGGDYRFIWDGADGKGQAVSTGIYVYQLRVGDRLQTKTLTLIK